MEVWPPPPEVVAGGLLTVVAWLLINIWRRVLGRLDRLEADAVLKDEHREREERLYQSVVRLQESVTEGFLTAQKQRDEMRSEIQRRDELHIQRESELLRDVHLKIDKEVRGLRNEIAEVRRMNGGQGA